ncbi:hypothetical protein CPLU01_12607 [Colletotrichum plurivorum]|uniref:Uncharacterized protein n=1 Tax=Colletotrichum plurivorum TaxID=2175906 RepID=A0A8H6JYF6_9PEZI|nr:hypothetical protein CPLU01_12607 [Colletotrichum plurivorum]
MTGQRRRRTHASTPQYRNRNRLSPPTLPVSFSLLLSPPLSRPLPAAVISLDTPSSRRVLSFSLLYSTVTPAPLPPREQVPSFPRSNSSSNQHGILASLESTDSPQLHNHDYQLARDNVRGFKLSPSVFLDEPWEGREPHGSEPLRHSISRCRGAFEEAKWASLDRPETLGGNALLAFRHEAKTSRVANHLALAPTAMRLICAFWRRSLPAMRLVGGAQAAVVLVARRSPRSPRRDSLAGIALPWRNLTRTRPSVPFTTAYSYAVVTRLTGDSSTWIPRFVLLLDMGAHAEHFCTTVRLHCLERSPVVSDRGTSPRRGAFGVPINSRTHRTHLQRTFPTVYMMLCG